MEEIRKKAIILEKNKQKITFTWIKAHLGIYGNTLTDWLAKEAARQEDIAFNRIPRYETAQHHRDQSILKWQTQWDRTSKGSTTKEFFPHIKDKITTMKIKPNFTAIEAANGKNMAYLHRFE
jgi:hypothetical protein